MIVKISTIYPTYWYEVDDKNRIFRCDRRYYPKDKIIKVLLSSRDSKKQAIKLAEQLAKEFTMGINAASY